MTDACVFVGPSAGGLITPPGIDRYGPAALGSLYRATELGYKRIGLVDGLFGNVPSVWHKEILYAISRGVEVVGGSSLGALRASELYSFGMIGRGHVFRLFKNGIFMDDDELCVLHAVKELKFQPLSLAMINIRFALKSMRINNKIDANTEQIVLIRLKSLHFGARTLGETLRCFCSLSKNNLGKEFSNLYVDVKTKDYSDLLNYLKAPRKPSAIQIAWEEIETLKWRKQFHQKIDEIPHPETW